MNDPETIHVPLRVLDAEDALRIVDALNAALNALWEVYGDQMAERILDRHCAGHDKPSLDEQPELPF